MHCRSSVQKFSRGLFQQIDCFRRSAGVLLHNSNISHTSEVIMERDENPRHHVPNGRGWGPRFRNISEEWVDPSAGDLFKMIFSTWTSKKKSFSPKLIDNPSPSQKELERAFPPATPNLEQLRNPVPQEIQATWIGHSTVLVQIGGISVLTDPIFGNCGPLGRPKRIAPPGLDIEQLAEAVEKIDAVVISHAHYDHLCKNSVRNLVKKFKDITFFVPLGQKDWFIKRQIGSSDRVIELDWWSSYTLTSPSGERIRFTFTPAQHWSMRSLGWDRNRNLWGSWLIHDEMSRKSFWFSGDTGYSKSLFEELGSKFSELVGSIDLSAIAIGAYEPNWFMSPQHINPEEAVKVHCDIGSKRSLAIHYATFPLTSEPLDEPPIRLEKALSSAGLGQDVFQALQRGSTITTCTASKFT